MSIKSIKHVLSSKVKLSNQIIEKDNKIKILETKLFEVQQVAAIATKFVSRIARKSSDEKKLKEIKKVIYQKKADKLAKKIVHTIFPLCFINSSPICNKYARGHIMEEKRILNKLEEKRDQLIKSLEYTNHELTMVEITKSNFKLKSSNEI